MVDFVNNFPQGFTPNTSQVKILRDIESAFKAGTKFIVCCAPTGSGKSFISKTLSNTSGEPSDDFRELITSYAAYKQQGQGGYTYEDECIEERAFGTYALTITKTLQDQYKQLFEDIAVLKGKSNYICQVDDSKSVETAPCVLLPRLKEECCSENRCPYYNARNEALISQFGTLNYNMYFSLPDHLKKRKYIVCDEASELEDQLVKQFTCVVNYDALKKSKISIPTLSNRSHDAFFKWVTTVHVRIFEAIEGLKSFINSGKKHNRDTKLIEYLSLRSLHSRISTLLTTWHESEYICEGSTTGINFIPLKVDKLADHLFKHAEKVILLSATIIDHKNFCKSLGIDDYKYIEVGSSFDAKKAPIFVNTKIKLGYKNLEQNLPKIVKQVKEICDHHKQDKGLIHTHTNTITKYLKNSIYGDRFLFREPGVNNEKLLEQHYETDNPTVIVSPSMSYGVDLKDDLARFQIIIKAPYLPMKDVRVEKLMKLDRHWYQNKMLSALIQACGRGIRSKDDYCNTYILDGAIIEQVIMAKNKLPQYFLERFM